MFYLPVQIFMTVFVFTGLVLPFNFWAAAWVGGLCVYYGLTAPGEPEHTGTLLLTWTTPVLPTAASSASGAAGQAEEWGASTPGAS